jgi:hypothetical protein
VLFETAGDHGAEPFVVVYEQEPHIPGHLQFLTVGDRR